MLLLTAVSIPSCSPPLPELPAGKAEETATADLSQAEQPSQEESSQEEQPSQEAGLKLDDPKAIHKKHQANRASSTYRITSTIKLDYDLSHPVYAATKRLILRHILDWVLPAEQRGGGSVPPRSPPPAPLLSPPRVGSSFTPNGAELMLEMWFTSQDNVNLLLEVCRQGLQLPMSELVSLRRVIDLYHSWFQVRPLP